jgi:hypothetical protein
MSVAFPPSPTSALPVGMQSAPSANGSPPSANNFVPRGVVSPVPRGSTTIACGGGAPQPHIEFTQDTNPATIADSLAATAKAQGGAAKEFTAYTVADNRVGHPQDAAFINGARVDGYGMQGKTSWPIGKLVGTVMASGVLQRGGTLALGGIVGSKLSDGLLSGLAKQHQITIVIQGAQGGIDLYRPDGRVESDPSRVIGQLHTRGGCGPGLQRSDG